MVRPTHLKFWAKLLLRFVRIGGTLDYSFGVGKDPVLYSFTERCARIFRSIAYSKSFDRKILEDKSREFTSKD